MKIFILVSILVITFLNSYGQIYRYANYAAPLYVNLADTSILNTPTLQHLAQDERVSGVSGQGRWLSIFKNKKAYFVQSIYLSDQQGAGLTFGPSKSTKAAMLNLPTVEGKLVYEGIVKTDSTLKKEAIYQLAREWFVNTFVSGKAVLQLEEKSEAKLMGNGRLEFGYLRNPTSMITVGQHFKYQFTVKIEARDGRYRYQIYNFLVDDQPVYYEGRVLLTRKFNFDSFYQQYKNGPTVGFFGNETGASPTAKEKATRDYKGILTQFDNQVQTVIASLNKAIGTPKGEKSW